ncbi:hypothetical protein Q4485_12160 [Granulosicoccaceae sp. 1_MG-2023]|nr:hypothetical protein [Granulosicoccaceae sp. 1_MG-2023]
MRFLDRLPMSSAVIFALLLGLAPFLPEPHLVEKLRMLAAGELTQPLDIFDLVMHAVMPVVLLIKLYRRARGLESGRSDGDQRAG